ncbi:MULTISPECIES: arsenic transporter [Methylobacterium]|uniref:Arsenical pump membrane protein n=4 Tax=Pseudomonadota TaxID=1224 RepID=A0ABQ4SW00_9HYPH|nr:MULTISPECIES: arsenic transporter [Methylobacterium]PIU05956.1 MAG: arsenical efflux pump membrane protein ArsB [Methylobacterium sp. CG09_land_8_20_14_0_10_71_15]PIU16473.1 MAG: arsenical efflux pump membrane protein ArsB [Methylobacterium sp. CG08_land_8_20_14_0_20_71_15]GBU16391.1 arylsulfatase [Methylobacterium sp.]GJE07379.1 Arsenical pump membrane protein [Methylobacterium jeotgali]
MLALAIFLVTLVFVIWQPRGLGIGWSALAGAAVALATGVIHPGDIPVVWHIVWDATFTFVALIIISLLLDEAGFFHWAALHVARWGSGSGRRLFPLVVLLGAAIAAVFANDGAALLLTPIVLAILLRLDFKPAAALAFIVACGFVADSTSLPLVISNLVNIVSANFFDVTFGRYAAVMVPVNLVSLAATLVVLWAFFRRDVPAAYPAAALERPVGAIRDPLVFRAAFPLLGVLLLAYFVTAPFGVPVAAVTCAGAAVLLLLADRGRVIPIRKVLIGAPWQIVLFSLGMYLVVYGLRNAGLTDELATGLVWLAGHGPWVATVGTGFAAAILSSVMNNMPSVLIGALSIQQAPDLSPLTRELMVYANVIGCDLGPKFTPIGSLATLLWLHVLDSKGQKITWGQYMKVGLVITPPVLLVTLVALAAWLPLLGTR